ncbi:MAG TPA: hypothetical protein VHS58_19510 [Acetobacteraceae bacterium]|jgi:hypothetical protein|nr:hypothetical protein [Acetobacteraceae bacterium]
MRRRHRAVHRRVWPVLAVILPLLVIAAVVFRPAGPTQAPAVRLSPP